MLAALAVSLQGRAGARSGGGFSGDVKVRWSQEHGEEEE